MKGRKKDMSKRGPAVSRSFWKVDLKIGLLVLVFLLLAGLFLKSFYQLQIVQHPVLAAKAAGQQYVTSKDSPRRGMILDRNGFPLVLSTYVYRVGMTPADVSSRSREVQDGEIVNMMGLFLGLDEEEQAQILEKIRADQVKGWSGLGRQLKGHEATSYVTIATEVAETDAMRLKDWLTDKRVGGVRFDAEERRVYNNQGLGSSVLGLTRVSDDGRIMGVSGLEATYDSLLSGQAGYSYEKRNNYTTKGVIPFSQSVSSPPVESRNLVSTLDLEAMQILQEELASVGAAAGLTAGVHGLVMEAKTGDILAMGQLASYDAADPAAMPLGFSPQSWEQLSSEEKTHYLSSKLWNNINITDLYEPGSVFKAVTLAIGLEEGVAWEETIFNDDPVVIQGEEISCYHVAGHGDETLSQAFCLSCNPVFVHLGMRVGQDLYYDWIRKLGFYDRTGIDLPAEAPGYLHSKPMPIDFANLTFGESSSMNAVSLARFFAVIGNGGYGVLPRLGQAWTEDGLETMEAFDLAQGNRLFSPETCQRVRSMMTQVVTQGTASGTFGAMGLNLGGKTGTAIDAADDRRTFSFVGLAPCDDPKYVVLVSIHKPETGITLSSSAARAANRVAARLLNREGIHQAYSKAELDYLSRPVELPDLSHLTLGEAALTLLQLNLNPVLPPQGFFPDQPLSRMEPAAGSLVGRGTTVWLYPDGDYEVEWVAVPDFQGCNYHESVWLAAEYGVSLEAVGIPSGPAQGQDIPVTPRPRPTVEEDMTGSPDQAAQAEDIPQGMVRRGQVVRVFFGAVPPVEVANND